MEKHAKLGDAAFPNAIVRLETNGKLHCYLCARFCAPHSNRDEHIVLHQHKVYLNRSVPAFEDCGESVRCKSCDRLVQWNKIKALTHKLQPWYSVSKPNCKLYYLNGIIKHGNRYHCVLCERPLDYWDSASDHFEDADHQRRRETLGQPADLPLNCYSVAISQTIVPGPGMTLECKACQETLPKPKDIKGHVKTENHKRNKEKFVASVFAKSEDSQGFENGDSSSNSPEAEALISESEADPSRKLNEPPNQVPRDRGICNFSQQQGPKKATPNEKTRKIEAPETASVEEVAAPPRPVDALSFVVSSASDLCTWIAGSDKQRKRKNPEPQPYCVICYSEIPGEIAVRAHLEGKRHREARAKYGCDEIQPIDGDHFFCMSCDRAISGFPDVCRHVTSNTHLSLVARGQENAAENAGQPEVDCLGCIYVVKQNAKKSFCQICDDVAQFPVPTKSINDHVASQRHRIALARYGCDKIVLRENGSYFCECCSCELANVEAVHLHVKEKRHTSFLIKVFSNRKEEPREKRKAESPTPVEPEIPGNLLSGYIARQINAASFPGAPEKRVQRGMISSFTVQPDDWLAPPGQSWPSENIARQNSVDYGFGFSGNVAEARDWLTVRTGSRRRAEPTSRDEEKTPLTVLQVKRYYCSVCGAGSENRTQLHVHMASHYTEEFARAKRNRGNGATINDEVFPNGLGDEPLVLSNGLENPPAAASDSQAPRIIVDEETDRQTRPGNATASPTKKKNWKVANLKKVAEILDFVHDHIYDLSEKLAEVEQGMMLGLVVDSARIYCLVCRELVDRTLDDYAEHLSSVDHCEYLEAMEADRELFKDFPDQFSDLELANEYMEETSAAVVRCIICNEDVANEDRALESHIYHEVHERKCEETRAIARRHYEAIAPRMRCDWYDVKKYWCVACRWDAENEVMFVGHLASPTHKRTMRKPENRGKTMIFDFCATCALLWYGYRSTRSYHTAIESHVWLERDGHYVLTELPKRARCLLAAPDAFVDEKIGFQDAISEAEAARERMLVADLEKAVTMRFPRARAYLFGSRISRLGAVDSDVDVFLDCRNIYDGNDAAKNDLLFFMNGTHQCLSKYPQLWDVEELLARCRSPIIRAVHRATGLACDISFENGLAVENTKLIKAYNQVFPMCRKITLFLKQWLLDCDLSGSDRITSYALYWIVIFYLQRESILPSVAQLIAMRRRSHIVAGWEVGVTYDFTYNGEFSNLSLKEFLTRFFTFYADFDFRYDVACPLLGEVVKKRAFIYPDYLPKEMKRYETHMRGPGKPEPLRIDSAMCVQDPFDLQHNLTKAVSKVQLNRFRKCCAKSLDLL